MTIPKMIRVEVASMALAIGLTPLAGCDSSTATTSPPPKPIPVANPRPDDPLKDVTTENESANMDKIKKAGEGK